MNNSYKLIIYFLFISLIVSLLYNKETLSSLNTYFIDKDDITISIEPINHDVKNVTADSENKVYFIVKAFDSNSNRIGNIKLHLKSKYMNGSCSTDSIIIPKKGDAIFYFTPKNLSIEELSWNDNATISYSFDDIEYMDSYSFKLVSVPIILIHGFGETSDALDNLNDYLTKEGFTTYNIDYNASDGVYVAVDEFSNKIFDITNEIKSNTILCKRFDVISHSFGGLVSRIYSSTPEYANLKNIRKQIFISVPHNGSHIASIGREAFDEQTVEDLIPEGHVFEYLFPRLLNKGLNKDIEVANLIGKYDEVVSPENVSLKYWGVETTVFDIGDKLLTIDNIFEGLFNANQIHHLILNNKKVYETISNLLSKELILPKKHK